MKTFRTCGAELLLANGSGLRIWPSGEGSTPFVVDVFAAVDTGFSKELPRRTEYAANMATTVAATAPKANQFADQPRLGVAASPRAARTPGRREAGTSTLAGAFKPTWDRIEK